jgi:hypothetical protein
VINVYSHYAERTTYWEGLSAFGVVEDSNVILGGDLNFTLSIHEVWGAHPWKYAHGFFFTHWLIVNHLVDLEPTKLSQT